MQRFGKQSLQLLVLLIGLVCFSLTDPASALNQVVTDTYSQTIAGDVVVYLNATYWRCDLVLCPAGTDQCVVTKSRSPTEPRDLIRRNICVSANKQRLVDESVTEPIKSYQDINFKLIVSSSGSSVLQNFSYSNTYTGTSYSSSSVNTDAVSKAAAKAAEKAAEKAAAEAVANAAANTAHINRQIARTLQQTGESVRRSLQTAHQDLVEAFRSAGLWGK